MAETTNGYFYLPAYGAKGSAEKALYDAGMQVADTELKACYDHRVDTAPVYSYVYLGAKTTEGTWRIRQSGNNLVFERYESAVWVEKGAITP